MSDAPIQSEGFLNPDAVVGEFGIVPGMSVADFGCGAGHIGILVAQKLGKDGRMIAFDILEEKLDSIKARARALGLDNVDTIRANLEVPGSTTLSESSQDIVLLINILFQSTKKSDIVREAKRVLKAGGLLIVVEWNKGAGGFGPPDNLRTDVTSMQTMLTQQGLSPVRSFSAGQFHYGLIFKK